MMRPPSAFFAALSLTTSAMKKEVTKPSIIDVLLFVDHYTCRNAGQR
jgi:hypothetical protein